MKDPRLTLPRKVVATLAAPKPSTGATKSVNELWRLRRGVPHTATVAPMAKPSGSGAQAAAMLDRALADGAAGASIIHGSRLSMDIPCNCGFHECCKAGPCAREMKRDPFRADHGCTHCAWYSHAYEEAKSREWFDAHDCAGWPEGTTGSQWRCMVHGDSHPFPTAEQAQAWGAEHKACEQDDAKPQLPAKFFSIDMLDPHKYVCSDCQWVATRTIADHDVPIEKTPAYRDWLEHSCGKQPRPGKPVFMIGDRVKSKLSGATGEVVAFTDHSSIPCASVLVDGDTAPSLFYVSSLKHVYPGGGDGK